MRISGSDSGSAQGEVRAADSTSVSSRIAPILTLSTGFLFAGCSTLSVVDPMVGVEPLAVRETCCESPSLADRWALLRNSRSNSAPPSTVTIRQLGTVPTTASKSGPSKPGNASAAGVTVAGMRFSSAASAAAAIDTAVAIADAADKEIIAYGFASITAQSGTDPAQRRLQAARSAKLDAYRNLAEQLYGFEFASDSTVSDSRVRDDQIRTRISGVISGAEIVALEPLGNDSYQATVRLPAQQVALLRPR